jgi:hypothetical protein
MKRWILAAVVVIALAFPGMALANKYLGPLVPQVNNDGVEIKVKQLNGAPHKVTHFSWHNVPVGSCFDSEIFFKTMRVRHHKFHGSGHPGEAGSPQNPPNPNVTVTIHAKFRHHNKKIRGTLRLQGTFPGGCVGADSGSLTYHARRLG